MNGFGIGRYRDNDTGRERWAVVDTVTHVWFFPEIYGKKAAERLAAKLNRGQEELRQLSHRK